jgi:hypothetical protein
MIAEEAKVGEQSPATSGHTKWRFTRILPFSETLRRGGAGSSLLAGRLRARTPGWAG